MQTTNPPPITVATTVAAPVEKVWQYWTTPGHITQWNSASDEWHSPTAENDLRPGGKFLYRMEAKDGSFGFDFGGTYDDVKPRERIAYTLGDGRKVTIQFSGKGNETTIVETFDPEGINSLDMQRGGWQAILDNFRKHTESLATHGTTK